MTTSCRTSPSPKPSSTLEARIAPLLPLHARAETAVLYEQVGAEHWREVATFRL